MRIVNQNARTERQEESTERLRAENNRLKAIIDYIGALDYPEIFEEDEKDE